MLFPRPVNNTPRSGLGASRQCDSSVTAAITMTAKPDSIISKAVIMTRKPADSLILMQ